MREYIYIHLPFCDVICHYCDFYTARSKDARHAEFFEALDIETRQNLSKLAPQLKAIYFGGGTPSASPPELIHKFLDLVRDRITPQTEISLEANPTNITAATVRAWKNAGINRVSLGIQSLNDEMLKKLGRVHSAQQAKQALALCLAEIPNVTGDLIYAVPGQGEEDPSLHALEMAQIGVKHFSAYHLTLEENHFLYPKLPEGEFAWKQVRHILDRLNPLGFSHYEVSNFGLPGFESRNNQNYWFGGAYLALGPSASGFDGKNQRTKNVADWEKYISLLKSGQPVIEETENLSAEQRKIEVIFTSLRTSRGLDLLAFQANFKDDLESRHAALIENWQKNDICRVTNGHLVLTFQGRMLGDEIARKLL